MSAEIANTTPTDGASLSVFGFLSKHKDQIAAALPRHITADRMARIALTELRKTPDLLKCDPKALFGAIIQCAQLGLEPGGALGHVWILPYKNRKENRTEPQVIIGYRGMIDLARRSGQIVSISARVVRKGDFFRFSYGLNETLLHKPAEEEPADGAESITHAYAVAKLRDGGVQFEVVTARELNRVAKDFGPWVDHPEEMAKKTAIRRLFKYLPVSIEMQRAAMLDERADAGVSQQHAEEITIDVAPEAAVQAPVTAQKATILAAAQAVAGEATKPAQEPPPPADDGPQASDFAEELEDLRASLAFVVGDDSKAKTIWINEVGSARGKNTPQLREAFIAKAKAVIDKYTVKPAREPGAEG
jgi:recombination protein RecT